jgi:hypothetical protein
MAGATPPITSHGAATSRRSYNITAPAHDLHAADRGDGSQAEARRAVFEFIERSGITAPTAPLLVRLPLSRAGMMKKR